MRRLLAALAVAAALTTVAATAAEADAALTDVGWWTRNPAAQAPEGGINVGIGPDGAPVSVAAVRVTSTTAIESALLILEEASGSVQADSAKLQVCATPNAWEAGPAQPYGDAPKPECGNGKVDLRRDAASSRWAGDVGPLLAHIADTGQASLMVVPAGQAAVPVTFEVRFRPPVLQATSRAPAAAPSGQAADDPPAPGGSPAASGNSATEPSTVPDAFPGTVETVAPAAPRTADGAAGAPAEAGTVTEVSDASSVGVAALPTATSPRVGAGTGDSTLQALAFLAIATVAGVAGGAGRAFLRRRANGGGFLT